MPGVSTLRYKDHSTIDSILQHRRSINWGGSWGVDPYRNADNEKLHELLFYFESLEEPWKITVSRDHGWFYTNNINTIYTVEKFQYLVRQEISQVQPYAPGTLVLKNPQHQFRSYFKHQKIPLDAKNIIREFMQNQTDVRLGPAFAEFLQESNIYPYVQQNQFMDYNNESFLTMFNLVYPLKIKKTVKLISSDK